MLRCIQAHHVDEFGDIPVGSLWEDDSPYVTDGAYFVDAATPAPEEEPAPRPVKKTAAKPVKES
jgi:hypothetical protein